MSGLSIVLVLFEIVIAVAVVWAILNEDFFIQIENRMISRIVSAFRKKRDPQPTPPAKPQPVVSSVMTEDDEFARFAPFVA